MSKCDSLDDLDLETVSVGKGPKRVTLSVPSVPNSTTRTPTQAVIPVPLPKAPASRELSSLDLERVAAGGDAKGAAGQACGAARKAAAICDSLGLSDSSRVQARRR